MHRSLLPLALLAGFATLALDTRPAHAASAVDEAPRDARELDVASLTCRSLLQAGGEERDLLLALFHGYVAGRAGTPRLDTVRMARLTDAVVDHCVERPADPLLVAFAAAAKSG